jgi:hypothetical protein
MCTHCSMLKDGEEKREKKRYLVGLAEVSNCYGGPEEGGWYYDAGQPVGSWRAFFRWESACEYRNHLESLVSKEDEFPGVGVGGCGDDDGMYAGQAEGYGLSVIIQDTPRKSKKGPEPWPKYRPHYE